MARKYTITIVHDETQKIVRITLHDNEVAMDIAYEKILEYINLGEYTVHRHYK